MSDIQPPLYEHLGAAPTGVCSRWLDTSPCGAAGTHHVIWDSDLSNGCICARHVAEIRTHWVYVGLHPYTSECIAFIRGEADWLPSEDRCAYPRPADEGDAAIQLRAAEATP